MGSKVFASLLIFVLLALVVMSTGCNQPGKTPAEVHRGHVEVLRVQNQQLMRDIDRTLDLDQPTKLTEMHMP
ncbi:MAG: hypothetical protein ABSG97_03145 [Sedimentisphaerales bacterium]